jgi:hypothetical protein
MKILRRIMEMLLKADSEILKNLDKAQGFCLFVTHCFRLFILCLSIDSNSLDTHDSEDV